MNPYTPQLDFLYSIIKKLHVDVKDIVEVGARNCVETLIFRKMFPDARITTFECNPENIPICRKNIEGTDITLIEKAVADEIGTIDFHILPTEDKGSSSLFLHKEIDSKTVTVPVTTLQAELKSFPQILWLDTQGAELKILKGCGDKIKEIHIVHSEIYFKTAYQGQPDYREIKNYLNSKGFSLYTFSTISGAFGDAIFVNNTYYGNRPQWLTEFYYLFIRKIFIKLRLTK